MNDIDKAIATANGTIEALTATATKRPAAETARLILAQRRLIAELETQRDEADADADADDYQLWLDDGPSCSYVFDGATEAGYYGLYA